MAMTGTLSDSLRSYVARGGVPKAIVCTPTQLLDMAQEGCDLFEAKPPHIKFLGCRVVISRGWSGGVTILDEKAYMELLDRAAVFFPMPMKYSKRV